MHQALVRKFSSKEIEETPKNYWISDYFPEPVKNAFKIALEKKVISPYDFILCPLYNKGDLQIGITGTLKWKENPLKGISRELGEEVGILPTSVVNLTFLTSQTREFYKYNRLQKQDYTVYALNVTDALPVLDHQQNVTINVQRDATDKVGCFVYGSRERLLAFMSSTIYRYQNEDDIIGLGAIPVRNVLENWKF